MRVQSGACAFVRRLYRMAFPEFRPIYSIDSFLFPVHGRDGHSQSVTVLWRPLKPAQFHADGVNGDNTCGVKGHSAPWAIPSLILPARHLMVVSCPTTYSFQCASTDDCFPAVVGLPPPPPPRLCWCLEAKPSNSPWEACVAPPAPLSLPPHLISSTILYCGQPTAPVCTAATTASLAPHTFPRSR